MDAATAGRQLSHASPLVGRRAELAVLRSELDRARHGEFRCLLLHGEPGAGKTRLATELLRVEQVVALRARAHAWGSTTAFGMWSEALEGHLRGLDRTEVTALCAGFLDDLAALLRSVAAAHGRAPTREPPRGRLLHGLVFLLGNLAERAPVVVLFDDVHGADASSWEALAYLARSLPQAPVLVVATGRTAELAAATVASDALRVLDQEGCLHRLSVGPLTADGLRELVCAVGSPDAPPRLVEWLAERTRGNPLFAVALLHALAEEGGDPNAPDLRSLPDAVTAQVASRTRLLDEPSVDVLERLAVLGRPVELRSLVGLTGCGAAVLSATLGALVRSRLVTEEERGRDLRYEIAHPLVQDAICQAIGGARRRLLHREIGHGLLTAGRLGEAAPHVAAAADADDTELIEVLCRAVRQAEEGEAYREALEILGSLTDLLPAGDPRWVAVVDALSWHAQWVVDHRADGHAGIAVRAMRKMDAALAALPDPAARGVVKFRLAGFLAWGDGDLAEAEVECRSALGLFEHAGDRHSALLAEHELAFIRGLRGDLAELRAGAARVAAAAEACGDDDVQRRATRTVAVTETLRGRFADGHWWAERAMELALRAGDRYAVLAGLSARAQALTMEGRIGEAWAPLGEAAAVDAELARDYATQEYACVVHWSAGEFGRAVAAGRTALSLATGAVSRRRGFGLAFAALSAAETGDAAAAEMIMRRIRPVYDRDGWFAYSDWAHHVDAVLSWRGGARAGPLAAMRRAADRALATGALPIAALILLDVAEVGVELGDPAVAERAASELGVAADEMDRDLHRGMAGISAAAAALGAGNPARAVRRAEDAVDLLAGKGYVAFSGRALDRLGQAFAATGDRRAVAMLTAAGEAFGACGAGWRRDQVMARLRKLGAPARTAVAALSGPDSLTRREREVARLAVAGHTAREIGARLYIGERTVEGHLARVYAKLGVGSKLQLVARAAELGIAAES